MEQNPKQGSNMVVMNEKSNSEPAFSNILKIPKAAGVTDYIKRELMKKLPIDFEELIDTLFEMQRTSTGFNPAVLSKARFKRMKAADCRNALMQIDNLLKDVFNSEEYALLFGINYSYFNIIGLQNDLNNAKDSKDIHNFTMIKLKLKNMLLERNEYELLLWLYKVSIDYYSRNNEDDVAQAALNDYIQCFAALKDKLNLKLTVDRSKFR